MGHVGVVTSIAFSRDGTVLASSEQHCVKLLDLKSRTVRRVLTGPAAMRTTTFTSDGKTLIVGSFDSISFWDVMTGNLLRTLRSSVPVNGLALSPDNRWLAVVGGLSKLAQVGTGLPVPIGVVTSGGEVQLWDLTKSDSKTLATYRASVDSVAFAPDGQTFATGATDSTVRIWNVASGKEECTFVDREAGAPASYGYGGVRSLRYSPRSDRIAAAGIARMKVWRRDSGSLEQTISKDSSDRFQQVSPAVFDRDGRPILIASTSQRTEHNVTSNKDTVVFRLNDAATLRDLENLYAMDLSPDESRVVAGSFQGDLTIWDSKSGLAEFRVAGGPAEMLAVAFAPGDKKLISVNVSKHRSGLSAPSLGVWDLSRGSMSLLATMPLGWAISPDGTTIAINNPDGISLFDMDLLKVRREIKNPESGFIGTDEYSRKSGISFQAMRAVGIAKSRIRVLDSSSEAANVDWDAGQVEVATISPDGRLVATGSNSEMKVWNATGELIRSLQSDGCGIHWPAFSFDNKLLAAVAAGKACIWDIASAAEVKIIPDASSVSFSRDSQSVAVVDYRGLKVRVVELPSGITRAILSGHTDIVRSVSFSHSGMFLATASRDATVKLWDRKTGRLLVTLIIPGGSASSEDWLAFRPDASYAGSSAAQELIRWRVGDRLVSADSYPTLRHPDLLQKVLSPIR
jgi:WD40 repeat protein